MKEIRTKIEIQSSLQIAWRTLTDFPGYDKWNPVIIHMTGIARLGEKLVIRLRTHAGKIRTYRPVITKLEENHELRWKGSSFIPGFLIGERVFTFDQITNNQIRLLHSELFSGLAANLGGNMLTKNVELSLHEMNIAFKKKVEEESGMH